MKISENQELEKSLFQIEPTEKAMIIFFQASHAFQIDAGDFIGHLTAWDHYFQKYETSVTEACRQVS